MASQIQSVLLPFASGALLFISCAAAANPEQATDSADPAPTALEVLPEDNASDASSIDPATLTEGEFKAFVKEHVIQSDVEGFLNSHITRHTIYGDTVQGWQNSGTNILAELERVEGGVASNLLIELDEEVEAFNDLSGIFQPNLPNFNHYTFKAVDSASDAGLYFFKMERGIWIELTQPQRRHGNAICYPGDFGFSVFSERPYTEWTSEQLSTLSGLYAVQDRISELEVCLVYSLGDDGVFTARAYNGQGTELVVVTAGLQPTKIIPARQLQKLLGAE